MASRRRRPADRTAPRRAALAVVPEPDAPCDCPECGSDADPGRLLNDLVQDAAGLADLDDPMDAELAASLFVAMVLAGGDDTEAAFAGGFIPALADQGTRPALTLLTAIGAVAASRSEPVAAAARKAAGQLTGAGVPAPAWADALAQPVTGGSFARLHDTGGAMSVLIGSFERAGRAHALAIVVDHEDCGAADQIHLIDGDDLPTVVAGLHASARADGVTLRTRNLGAAEYRWYAEQALDARAAHDEGAELEELEFTGEDGPGYAPLAVLTANRLAALPVARRPRGAVVPGHTDDSSPLIGLQQLMTMLADSGAPAGLALPGQRRPQAPKLPAKRKKANGPAPAYQLKVGLRGAKPPIWRRLVVPGDITLNRLHRVLQAAFGWEDSHLYAFDTAYGQFGVPDRELGHRSDASVTLEQVAAVTGERFRYTYDFGDDWEHDILVEKVSAADPAVTYPVCVGGRRAAPPEDCGGIWGYHSLVEVLAEPEHPDHRERLDWLGLADASEFTPQTFDAARINEDLRAL